MAINQHGTNDKAAAHLLQQLLGCDEAPQILGCEAVYLYSPAVKQGRAMSECFG